MQVKDRVLGVEEEKMKFERKRKRRDT